MSPPIGFSGAGERLGSAPLGEPLGVSTVGPVSAGRNGDSAASPVDGIDVTTRPSALPLPSLNAGLPEVLCRDEGALVVHGTDPGDFYCEHMFLLSQLAAAREGSKVASNAHGEKLVGFLHVPGDRFVYHPNGTPGATYRQGERHRKTRAVVASALRGFYRDAAKVDPNAPVRFMLNGYGAFGGNINNPTGEMAREVENVHAIVFFAFGDRLLERGARELPPLPGQPPSSRCFAWKIADPETSEPRELVICATEFPVTDEAIDGTSPWCIQDAMAQFQPNAVLSMGVCPGSAYRAEHHADNGGLGNLDKPAHTRDGAVTHTAPENYALARAIFAGSQPSLRAAFARAVG